MVIDGDGAVFPWETYNVLQCIRGFQRIRHVGFLPNRAKAEALRTIRALLAVSPEPPIRQKKTAAEWIGQLTGTDITQGPQWGHRP